MLLIEEVLVFLPFTQKIILTKFMELKTPETYLQFIENLKGKYVSRRAKTEENVQANTATWTTVNPNTQKLGKTSTS